MLVFYRKMSNQNIWNELPETKVQKKDKTENTLKIFP